LFRVNDFGCLRRITGLCLDHVGAPAIRGWHPRCSGEGMATRMATLLYGEKPNTDVEAGNRADTADTVDMPAVPAPMFPYAPSFVPPSSHVTPGVRAAAAHETPVMVPFAPSAPAAAVVEPQGPQGRMPTPTPPPMRPTYPTPSPWVQPSFALRGLVLGLVAAAVLFAGLAIFGIALAWSYALTTVAKLALMILGGYLIGAGVAYIVSVEPRAAVTHA
jgi:hypothetical protein